MRRGIIASAGLVLLAISVACGSDAAETQETPVSPGPDRPILSNTDDYTQTNDENGLTTILATTDIGVGRGRFAFVLTQPDGLVKFPVVRVKSFHYPDGYEAPREGPVDDQFATFREFPFGTRGVYSANYLFDRAGDWGIEVSLPDSDGTFLTTEHRFTVKPEALAPDLGDRPPLTRNRTLSDVGSIAQLTTGSLRDPELYDLAIPDALSSGRPFAVVFASPAFCTTAVCGPQVEVVSELNRDYGERMDFIHVDLFDNPHEIQGDLDRAVHTPLLEAWGLLTDEWTFVVDADGAVTGRFEGFAPYAELEETILSTLGAS